MANPPITPDAPVLTERQSDVLLITLNRPHARNAINLALSQGLAAALDLLDADPDLRVGVLTGAGAGFCAGMDLKAFVDGEWPLVGDRGFGGICTRSADKPLIAAVEGFAVAGGLEVALSCDMIVAARGARLGTPEVKRGLAAGAGALIRMAKRIPYHIAMEIALAGDLLTAERAYELGLVNAVCEPGHALPSAMALAHKIAANAPLAVRVSKQITRSTNDWTEAEAWERQLALIDKVRLSKDAIEGARAFAEKRTPQWKGV